MNLLKMNSILFCLGLSLFTFLAPSKQALAASASLSGLTISTDTTFAYFRVSYSGFSAKPSFRIFLDTDFNTTTGYPYGVGADYMVQNDILMVYTGSKGSWQWTRVGVVNFSSSTTQATWQVRLTDIDSPRILEAKAQTPSPEVSSATVKTVFTKRSGSIQAFPSNTYPLPRDLVDGSIANGSTVHLNCGTTYHGQINIANKSNITIDTNGTCGRALITPAVPVSGWQRLTGNIYYASVAQEVAQVFVDGQLMDIAHFPNTLREITWLQPLSVTETTLSVSGLPATDIVGAKISYRGPYPWAIGTRSITAYNGSTITAPAPKDLNLISEDSPLGKFYLEGKLWMLNSPGEWAWSNGKLYLMMPDAQVPGSRVHAAPNVNSVINARGSTGVTLRNLRLVGGYIGVDGSFSDQMNRGSIGLTITGTEIAFSNWSGIYATTAQKMTVVNSDVTGALHTGIYARYGTSETKVLNSRFTNVNFVGMHKGSDGSIFLNFDNKAQVLNNTITNSGKSGIFIGGSKYSLVKGNRIDGACRIHGDCGGIYLFARDKVALNTYVESNTVKNVNGDPVRPGSTNPERYGIYLDDYSTGVTVVGNTVSNCDSAMQLHLAFGNMIIQNRFSANVQRHILFSDSGGERGSMRTNIFSDNTFVGPQLAYYLAVSNPMTAANLNGNTYENYNGGVISPSNVPYK